MKGEPKPWLPEEAIVFLNQLLNRNSVVLEFGSGNSTLWLAKRAAKVVSYEHDREWWEKAAEKIWDSGIVNVMLIHDPDYPTKGITRPWPEQCDVTLVDGRGRVNCIMTCWDRVKPQGWIVLDNSERVGYKGAIEFLDGLKWSKVEKEGIVSGQRDVTSFWKRPG